MAVVAQEGANNAKRTAISQKDKQTLLNLLNSANAILPDLQSRDTESAISNIKPVLASIRKDISNDVVGRFNSYADSVRTFLKSIRLGSNRPSSYINSATSTFHNLEIKLKEVASGSISHADSPDVKDYICHALSDDYFTSMTVDEFRNFFNS